MTSTYIHFYTVFTWQVSIGLVQRAQIPVTLHMLFTKWRSTIKLQEAHLIYLLLVIYLWEKKKRKKLPFWIFQILNKTLCILSLSLFSTLLIFVAFNIAIFNKNKGKPKSNEISDQDKRVMHSLNGLLDSFQYLQLKGPSVASEKINAITSKPGTPAKELSWKI